MYAKRPVFYLFLTLAVIALDIAGLATNVMVAKLPPLDLKIRYSLWEVCLSKDSNTDCHDYNENFDNHDDKKHDKEPSYFYQDCGMDTIRTLRAFGILSVILAGVICLGLGLIDLANKLPKRAGAGILSFAALLLCVSNMVFWIVWAIYYDHGCNDHVPSDDLNDSKWGPSPCLFIGASAIALTMIAVPLVTRTPDGDEPETIAILG